MAQEMVSFLLDQKRLVSFSNLCNSFQYCPPFAPAGRMYKLHQIQQFAAAVLGHTIFLFSLELPPPVLIGKAGAGMHDSCPDSLIAYSTRSAKLFFVTHFFPVGGIDNGKCSKQHQRCNDEGVGKG